MLYQLVFRNQHGESVIHIGTHAQCMKTVHAYCGAYDLLKDHSVFAGKDIEDVKKCFFIEDYK